MSQGSKRIAILKDRATMLQKARQFFSERAIMEVDCPILTESASIDAHIDLISAICQRDSKRYLHSSPEYGMKRLLAEGLGDIYQLSHVFRDGEYGLKHNPEFMMAEWYRVGMSFEELIKETVAFIELFIGRQTVDITSYRDAFLQYARVDPYHATKIDLINHIKNLGIDTSFDLCSEDKDTLLSQILTYQIEPKLGFGKLTVLSLYPPSQSALAVVRNIEGVDVALRFEVYYQGIELANGYYELQDYVEQKNRLEESNEMRKALGKGALPVDYRFLDALKKGLPECAGVAVGFDRLLMLRHNVQSIESVIPFSWNNA